MAIKNDASSSAAAAAAREAAARRAAEAAAKAAEKPLLPSTSAPTTSTKTTAKGSYWADGMDIGRKIELGTKTETKRASPPANGPWSKDEFEAGTKTTTETKGSVSITADTVSASVKGGFSQEVTNAKGYGVSFGVNTEASVVSSQKTENGVTTFEVEAEASITVSGGVKTPKAGLELAHSEGLKASYSVAMPEAAAKTVDPKTVNPLDPASMPTGTVVTLDGSRYSSNEFKATFQHLAVETKVTDSTGVSVAVEKTGDHTVRVTAGPTQAVEAYNGVGLDLGVASAKLGREDSLSGATLKTAEFDLSTEEGKAAYNDFLTTGTIPSNNGPGVSGVATIEKLDFSSQTTAGVSLGPIDLSFKGQKNTGSSVVTSLPDGTKSVSSDIDYGGNTPLHLDRKYGADGKEILSERRYSITMSVDENSAQLVNAALTGDVGQADTGPVKAGQTVTLTFTEDQMRSYMEQTQKTADAGFGHDQLDSLVKDYDGNFVNSPEDFAISLARNLGGGDYQQAMRLWEVANGADGNLADRNLSRIDATVTVN